MVLVKDLARLFNGLPGDFQLEIGTHRLDQITVDYNKKRVLLAWMEEIDDDLKPWDGESERFFPNMVGMNDDDADYRTNTTQAVESGKFGQKQTDRFVPATNGLDD